MQRTQLKRTLGFWALAVYGIGDILGAGIYALIGEVAGEAGIWSPLAFLMAMTVAGLTGLTYAELVARFPHSGGEATFCLQAFGKPRWAFLVGWLVLCSGVVSMATVTHAFGNYLQTLTPNFPEWSIWLLFLSSISLLNFWGIQQSSAVNILFTLVEASGLVLVTAAGVIFLSSQGVPDAVTKQDAPFTGLGVMSAAAVAFFAFIGFEDMVNIAEEVHTPEKVFPRAILTAVVVCGTVYVAVSVIAVAIVPVADLSSAKAPLVEVVRRAAPVVPPLLFTGIALIAVSNTGLLNAIMASRLIYGMSRQKLLPGFLTAVHAKTQTPHRAVISIFLVGVVLVFSGTLAQLAETTSLLLLIVFASVNASAIRLRLTQPTPATGFRVPIMIPPLALLTCLGLGAFVSPQAFATGCLIIVVGIIMMFTTPLHSRNEEKP